ncbi:MAG TPA: hypothetical protein PLK81_02140 [Kiritimatiellia bacterium]|nr:hypothetical protein [Kiritimatiellia bacterium]
MAGGYKAAYGLERAGGRLVLARATRRSAPQVLYAGPADSEEARRILAGAAREAERGSAALAAAAPAEQTVIRRLRAPFASVRKAARVWASLLDVELPFPVEAAVCAYGPPRLDDGGTVAVAAAIRQGDLAAFQDACRAAGVDPTHADAEGLALWEQLAVETPPARAGQPRALVWLGAEHVLVLRGRGTELLAAHMLRASPVEKGAGAQDAFDRLWGARLGPILAAHLAETESSEMDVWWAGIGAEDDDLTGRLRRLLPSGLALRHEAVRQPASLLARALARRAANGAGINFRTGEYAHPARLRKEARVRRAAVAAAAAAALAVLGLNAGEAVLRQRRDADWQGRLTAAARAIAGPVVLHGQEARMVENALARRDEETQAFRRALDPEGLEAQLVGVLEDAEALELDVSRLALSPLALAMEGSAASIQAIERLAERLEARGWAVQSDTPGRTSDDRQRFILKGAARHEG